jgi:hypothetical protein
MFSPRRDDDELEVREKEALEVRDGKSGIRHADCGSGGEPQSADLLETSPTNSIFCETKHSSFWSSLFICLVFSRELVSASIEVSPRRLCSASHFVVLLIAFSSLREGVFFKIEKSSFRFFYADSREEDTATRRHAHIGYIHYYCISFRFIDS